jgi:heat shock protein HtpX
VIREDLPVSQQGAGGLDRRRGWARVEATVACLVGISVFALTAAGLVIIAFAAVARAWSWFTDRDLVDAPVWSWAPGGAAALAVLAVAVSFAGAFWYFWQGAAEQVLREIGAVPLRDGAFPQYRNVVEGLCIGLGTPMPELYVCDEPVPNAISTRSSRHRALCLTWGCSTLPRDELEALCAHELGHLTARDAHWVASGMVALSRARRFADAILGLGLALAVLVGWAAWDLGLYLWSTGLVAISLLLLGWLSRAATRRLELSVRHRADEIADVVAIRLARNPASLGALCARLADDTRRVRRTGARSELLWFETVEELEESTDGAAASAEVRDRTHLVERALAAYGTARVPVPPVLRAAT